MLLYSSRRFKNVGVKALLKFGPRAVPMVAEHNHISSLNMNVINSRSLLTMDDDIGNQYATVLVLFDFRRCRMPIAGIICCYLLCGGDRSTLPTHYMALQIQFSSPFVDAVRSAMNFTPSKGLHLAFGHSAIQNHER